KERGIVSIQNSIRLNDINQPQPDVTILRPRTDYYKDALARGKDILIAIEVSDATLYFDRSIKLPRYAANGIREAWVVDLSASQVEVHSKPRGGRYTRLDSFGRGDNVKSGVIDGLTIAVNDLLP